MQGRVGVWIFSDLEKRLKQVSDDLLKILHQLVTLVDVEQARDLDNPPYIVRIHLKNKFCQ